MPKDKYIGIVRRNLWSRGYRVKTAAEFYDSPGYDLLVEGKAKVLVLTGKGAPDCLVEGDASSFDMVALVSFDAAKRPVILYTHAEGPTPDPKVVFGLPASFSKDEKKKSSKARDRSKVAKG